MSASLLSLRARARALLLAYCLSTLVFAGVVALVLLGRVREIPFQAYLVAGKHWLAHAPLYDLSNIDGFQYLPQSAALFATFARMTPRYAGVLWRCLCFVGFVTGERRLSRQLTPGCSELSFLCASVLSAAPMGNALCNGQANLALAAISLHTTAALIARRYGQASLLLSCGFALKPLLIVPLLIVFALYPATRVRIALSLVVLGLLPFLIAEPAYVLEQYASCLRKLQACAQPDRLFEDLGSMLWLVRIRPPQIVLFTLRALIALLVLWSCQLTRRRMFEPLASCHVMALSLSYLMLFNPRTLSTSYVMVAGLAAVLAPAYWWRRQPLRAAALACCALAWNVNHHVLAFVEHWHNALACCAFCVVLLVESAAMGSRVRNLGL